MNNFKNVHLTDKEDQNYHKINTLCLALNALGLFLIFYFDSWFTLSAALGIVLLATAFLLYKQKKLKQHSDLQTNLAFVSSSVAMVLILGMMFLFS